MFAKETFPQSRRLSFVIVSAADPDEFEVDPDPDPTLSFEPDPFLDCTQSSLTCIAPVAASGSGFNLIDTTPLTLCPSIKMMKFRGGRGVNKASF